MVRTGRSLFGWIPRYMHIIAMNHTHSPPPRCSILMLSREPQSDFGTIFVP